MASASARKSGVQVRLYSRPGNDFTRRFPLITEALARLRLSKKCRPLSKKCKLNYRIARGCLACVRLAGEHCEGGLNTPR
jgi:hypothetical protein